MERLRDYIEGLVGIEWLGIALTAVLILAVTAAVARVLTRFLRHVLQLDEVALPSSSIFVNIGRAAVWILGLCTLLSTCFAVDVSTVIAALGIGGIAVSLGFQDTISNLIGGLQVSLAGIVRPGDNIEVGSSTGVVKDVTWRHTTIENAKGQRVVIPNSIINKTALVHLPPACQASVPFVVAGEGLPLGETALAIEAAAREAARSAGALEKEPQVLFSEVLEFGFKGTVTFRMADAAVVGKAVDAVVRAIAPLTREGACGDAPRGASAAAGRSADSDGGGCAAAL